jgi:hypothetical protein
MRISAVALSLVLVVAGSLPLASQDFRASILGQVLDASGAVVVGARIVVVHNETNTKVETRTNETGNYTVPFLVPGQYTVSAGADGFKTTVRGGIIVQVMDRIAVDLRLEVGAVSDQVTVTAESPTLQTASADLGFVVERYFLDRLPITTQSVMVMADMAPGVMTSSGGYTSNAQNDIVINGGGGWNRGNDVTVDGVPGASPRQGGLAVTIPMVDAVQEFKVQTTMFDAASGRSNAGGLSITTRSGSNEFHGSGHYFLQNKALNANGWENNRLGLEQPDSKYYLFGGTFGGPVRLPKYNGRDRTFFFAGFERTFNAKPMTALARVPTEAERTGDFSKTLAPNGAPLAIYDPYSSVVDANQRFVSRQAFPGARIPASLINPIGQAVMNVLPLPNLNVPAQVAVPNWAKSSTYTLDTTNMNVRIDQQVGSRHRVYFRFSDLRDNNKPTPNFFVGAYSVPPNGLDNIGHGGRRNKSAALDETVIFSPSLVVAFRYGFTRTGGLGSRRDGDELDPALLKLPEAITAHQHGGGWPVFDTGENMAIIGSEHRKSFNDTHALQSNANKLHGAHTLRFGVDYRLLRWNESKPGTTANGQFFFSNKLTMSNPATSTTGLASGTSMASLLLGLPATNSNNKIGYASDLSVQNHYVAGFFQDDWKIHRRLTLNIGLRYEVETPFTERFDRLPYGFDVNALLPLSVPGLGPLRGGITFVNKDGKPRRQGVVDKSNFGPRLGLAYSLNEKTVLRSGYGLFYSTICGNILSYVPITVPTFNAQTPYVGSLNSDYTVIPGVNLSNPFPNGYVTETGSSKGLLTELGNSIKIQDSSHVLPYVQQWQFNIQRQLPGKMLAEGAYVGTHSLKGLETLNLSEVPDRFYNAADVTPSVPNPFLGILPPESSLGKGATIKANKLRVAFPQFNQVSLRDINTKRALYHGLQTRLQKRTSRGLTVVANYTFSKVLMYEQYSAVNERHYRTVAETDRPHMLRVFATYDLPLGHGHSFGANWPGWVNGALGGWGITWWTKYTAGEPLGITDSRGRPIPARNPVLSGSLENRLGDRLDPVTHLPLNPYFDTTAFLRLPDDYRITPEPERYGWFRGPSTLSHKVTLFKTFRLTEKARLDVRAEVSSPFNTPQFDNPQTDMSSPTTFGTITSAGGSRTVLLGAKVRF